MMGLSRILVTGGTGFFGCSLLDEISKGKFQDCHFTMISRRAGKFEQLHAEYSALSNVEFLSSDVRDFGGSDRKFDYIIHAATPSVDAPDDVELRDIIVNGTQKVLDFAKK